MAVDQKAIMNAHPRCNCCRKHVTRIILPNADWNETGGYMFHCKISGKITPIKDIEWVIANNRQELAGN